MSKKDKKAGKGKNVARAEKTELAGPATPDSLSRDKFYEREKTQVYIQRYIPHMPAAGEVVIFDRSWYNRPGVERVMGFCSEQEVERYPELTPRFEAYLVESYRNLVPDIFSR